MGVEVTIAQKAGQHPCGASRFPGSERAPAATTLATPPPPGETHHHRPHPSALVDPLDTDAATLLQRSQEPAKA